MTYVRIVKNKYGYWDVVDTETSVLLMSCFSSPKIALTWSLECGYVVVRL